MAGRRKRPKSRTAVDELRFRGVVGQNGKVHAAVLDSITLCGAGCRLWEESDQDISCRVCSRVVDAVVDEYSEDAS